MEILQSKDEIKDEYNNTAIIQNRQTPQASQQQDTSPALIENRCLGLFENSSLMNFKRTTCVGVNLSSQTFLFRETSYVNDNFKPETLAL